MYRTYQKMYTHFSRHHLLKCIHFLAVTLYTKLHICISKDSLLGNEFIYDKTDLLRIIIVYGTSEVLDMSLTVVK
jgi:hypothetical protein